MGNIKLRPCCINQAIARSVRQRLKFDIPIKIEHSKLISIDKDTVSSIQKEQIRDKTITIKILKIYTIT